MKKAKLIILIVLVLFFILICFDKGNDDNIIYISDFLDKKDYQKLLSLNKDKDTFIYEKFRYIKPLEEEDIYHIFYNDKYLKKVQRKLNNKIYQSDFPIEHRIYPKESKGMAPHIDTLLYQKPQYEAVYTIRNKSNSLTKWKDNKGKLHSKWTEPNSLMIVKAQGYEHFVTPPEIGEREILKLIYTQTNQTNQNYEKEMKRFNGFK